MFLASLICARRRPVFQGCSAAANNQQEMPAASRPGGKEDVEMNKISTSNLETFLCLGLMSGFLLASQGAGAAIAFWPSYIEDFSDDTDPTQPGFASAVFIHTANDSFSSLTPVGLPPSGAGESTAGLYTGIGDAGFNFNQYHRISFDLPTGTMVTNAAIGSQPEWNSIGGERYVRWNGTLGSAITNVGLESEYATVVDATFTVFTYEPWFVAAPSDIGYIQSVDLSGHNVVWDHLMIGTQASEVPLPAAAWLFGAGLAGLLPVAGRRRA